MAPRGYMPPAAEGGTRVPPLVTVQTDPPGRRSETPQVIVLCTQQSSVRGDVFGRRKLRRASPAIICLMRPHDEALFENSAAGFEKTAATPQLVRLVTRLGPPIVCFVLSRALLHAAAISTGNNPFTADTWSRWDSEQYLSITERGYELSSCEGIGGYDPTDWCGNDAWLPGYPLLIKLFAGVGHLPYAEAGVLLSAGFAFASLLSIWLLFLRASLCVSNVLVLLLAAFFPGHIYDHAVFPIAQFVFFALLCLWFYGKRRFVFAGLCAAAASFSYSSGLFLIGAFALHALVLERDRIVRLLFTDLAWPCGGALLGFLSALVLQWHDTGAWNAFFLVQKKYGYSPRTPFELWSSNLSQVLANWPHGGTVNGQTLFVAVLCLLMLGYLVWGRTATRLDVLLAAFAIVYWLLPIALGGKLSLYRAEATLLPAIPLARRIPWPILGLLVCMTLRLSWLIARKFFKGSIM